jgi:DHA1 family bicyclomycin/chloramphenicol resistance-like MFS transporter
MPILPYTPLRKPEDVLQCSNLSHRNRPFMSQSHNRYLIIVILGALSTISPFAIDMYLPAFPQIATALHTSTARISLSLPVTLPAGAGTTVLRPAARPVRPQTAVVCRTGSVHRRLAALPVLAHRGMAHRHAFRAGDWAAAARRSRRMAMVRDFFPAKETAKIISLLILIFSASPLLAPSVGVFVAVHLGWQWVFIVLVAVRGPDAVRLLVAFAAGPSARPHRLAAAAAHFSQLRHSS